MPRTLLLLLVMPLAGCTATLATIRLLEADRALVAAEDVGAPTAATYEYTMAARHREEAWDASNHAQYRVAVDLSRTSVTWSEQAKIVATGGKRDVRQVGDDLSDQADEIERPERRTDPSGPTRAPGDLDDEDFSNDDEETPR